MRTSNFLLATLRENPADAEIVSHQLMLRSGMIRKLSTGIYTWLPLGLMVLKKTENIIRSEMNRIGAIEILMPTIQPAELWKESGRWDDFGDQLLKIKDHNQHDFCFGPTHEEIVTDLIRREIRSYKQLPLIVYQIQTKFRDEMRPRFGVMRGREFIMKDAYSFHLNEISMIETYDIMYRVYEKIFSRLGLKFCSVLADTGNIGGSKSHEFQVLADSGEDQIVYSDMSNYAANIEMATYLIQTSTNIQKPNNKLVKVVTPKVKTIVEVAKFLKVSIKQILKTLLVKGKEISCVALVLRGDHELNEIKASKLPEIAQPLTFVDPEKFRDILGCSVGFIGPLGLKFPIIVDHDAALVNNFICGANSDDEHLINVNWGRDLPLPKVANLRKVIDGDLSPDGKGKLKFARGIEVGQVFQLGQKYSKAMHATVLDNNGRAIQMFMGCYGIGVTRTIAAAIEQNHDERGIIWQEAMAPFQVAIVPVGLYRSYLVREFTDKIYQELINHGFEVLLDDRRERPGVLFADMDLIGIPHRIIINEGSLDSGMIEYKHRANNISENVCIDNLVLFISNKIK
ncbi:MAG: proline--tRNA ligase [Coxiellaceae bacterium]|jgi:prolyl-tRNA synthetase|nr:proline--tRNA ligase [Coxiellaceae bacterium]